jgi:hypothetical protein
MRLKTLGVILVAAIFWSFSHAFLSANTNTKNTQPAKADPCMQYHEKALKALEFGEGKNVGGFTLGGKCAGNIPCEWVSDAITAYSFLYQNCRDIEKRK